MDGRTILDDMAPLLRARKRDLQFTKEIYGLLPGEPIVGEELERGDLDDADPATAS
jgi:hypothetical protein